jgi:hypothetical protein
MAQSFKALAEKLAPPPGGADFTALAALLGAPDAAPQGREAPRRRRHLSLVPKLRDVELEERFAGLTYSFEPTPTTPAVDPMSYDHVSPARIELWHHAPFSGPSCPC